LAISAIVGPLERTEQRPPVGASDVAVAPKDRFYRPELDLLRFCAFLSVFLYHVLPGFELSHHTGRLASLFRLEVTVKEACSLGVCLFFLLSAFLITELLERERAHTGSIQVRSFYVRRILRIWPLYFSFLFGGIVLGLVIPSYRIEAERILAFLLLSGNWYVAAVNCGASPIAPLWSISLEEQFYVAWPWVAKIGGRTSILALSLVLLPISWLTLFRLSHSGPDAGRIIWVNSFVQFQFFALGALLALGLNGRIPRLRMRVRMGILLAGFLTWLTAQWVFGIRGVGPSPSAVSLVSGYMLVAIGCVLLFLGFLGMPRHWVPGPLAYLGKISYGLYVFHALAIDCAWKALGSTGSTIFNSVGSALGTATRFSLILTAALVMTILLAMASYRFLEQPFLRMKERFTFVRSRRA